MNWISRYMGLLEAREANRARHVDEALAFQRERFAAKQAKLDAAQRKSSTPSAITIPPDLEAVILQESADWLRDEMRQTYRKLFVEYGDWNMVRAAVGIGAMEEVR